MIFNKLYNYVKDRHEESPLNSWWDSSLGRNESSFFKNRPQFLLFRGTRNPTFWESVQDCHICYYFISSQELTCVASGTFWSEWQQFVFFRSSI